ncbi:TCR/Tet family MFS transporter [Sphingomonas montanisoli]|uniref:TCR/Tet family MFS transporter n=2 Tax=Sphingomonas montanisoli TaxID=2606412 RepID=A0A5D9CCU7_9SPHN|nr:TCR/Tet family MFS transporter [Sphingomonas montanisoli]TZG28850.1 TCR/Tet family MFS transporter [Sphingomonas montanisoli]
MPSSSIPTPPRENRAAIAFILITAMFDVMAMGLVIPVLPTLITEFAGSNAAAGEWNGVLVALWAMMQFVCSPLIGSLSDRFGRRPVILISTAGLAADWVMMAMAPSMAWLVIGRIIGGVTSSSFTAVNAYMADITPPEGRARAYGLIGAAFGAGFVIGPALGGMLGVFGPRVPFWTAAALSAIAFLYGLLVLPESLPKDRRMAFSWRRANPVGALTLLRSHPELASLATVNFLVYFSHHVFAAVYVLYADHRYGIGTLGVGLLLAGAGVLDMVVQGLVVGPVTKRLGDRVTMLLGLFGGAFGLAMIAFAQSPLMFALALIPNAAWGLAMPTIQAMMTRRVSEREQGQLQGANNSVGAIAGIGSPIFFGWIYAMTITTHPWAAFGIAAAVLLAASGVGVFVHRTSNE